MTSDKNIRIGSAIPLIGPSIDDFSQHDILRLTGLPIRKFTQLWAQCRTGPRQTASTVCRDRNVCSLLAGSADLAVSVRATQQMPHPVVDQLIDEAMLIDQPANKAAICPAPHALWP